MNDYNSGWNFIFGCETPYEIHGDFTYNFVESLRIFRVMESFWNYYTYCGAYNIRHLKKNEIYKIILQVTLSLDFSFILELFNHS